MLIPVASQGTYQYLASLREGLVSQMRVRPSPPFRERQQCGRVS
jgi:hypothetical protein